MATQTSKRGLRKPETSNYVSVVTDINNNMDNLDDAVPDSRKINGYDLSQDRTLSKSDVGLGNVDNTADINKPISTAQQAALDLKQAEINDLKSALCGITKAEASPEWNAGHYYTLGSSATSADVENPSGSSANYASVYFSCEEGDIFLVTSLGGSGARCFAFLSSASGDNNILERAGSSQSQTGLTNYRAVAPANAVYAIFNADVRSPYYVYKLNPTLDYLEDCLTEQNESWT